MHKDYLGTILAITDEKGKLVEERHFDAWGNLTHDSMQVLDRGYTSHEHLQEVGLIHMNGRLCDPMLRRFLNADENIQDPTNTQCYNKYGYVMNNPLMFNDPSGEYGIGIAITITITIIITIGVIVAALTYTANVYFKYGNLKYWNIYEAHEAMFWGAVSAVATYGVGTLFSAGGTIVNTIGEVWSVAAQAAAHGIVQGVLSSVQGGNFWSAALSGAFGSLGASAFGAIGGDFAKSTVGTITFGAISGGVGAELSGGNFWQGVVIGGMVAGLNHAAHAMIKPKTTLTEADIKKIYDAYPSGDTSDPNFVHRDDVYKNIGGDIYNDYLLHGYDSNGNPNPAYANTCALRLSTALNKSGYTIPKTNGTFSGANKLNYFYKVDKIQVYLSNTYNFSQASLGMQIQNSIIIQKNCGWSDATGHVDVLYGGRAGSHFYQECTTTFYSSK
ncbi:hypothetical protein EH230_14050 [Flavobacterium columnare]|uniref:Teneurin-like YD-shell domain-containing protein n=2 Tax=Flavobacterium TaxID=237 RepID=A0A437U8C0_9FLAO|nr:T6SS effector amidase Tae4 family protein [Flavobacterium columnare]RVU89880.1 hypothetical protein EH230_14050 [Flavobacterium columnare]